MVEEKLEQLAKWSLICLGGGVLFFIDFLIFAGGYDEIWFTTIFSLFVILCWAVTIMVATQMKKDKADTYRKDSIRYENRAIKYGSIAAAVMLTTAWLGSFIQLLL